MRVPAAPLIGAALAAAGGAGRRAPPFARLLNDSSGAWWVARAGSPRTVSLGVTDVRYAGYAPNSGANRYADANDRRFGGNHTAWADASAALVRRLGFNTIGHASDAEVNGAILRGAADGNGFYTPVLQVGHRPGNAFPDVFSPDFAADVRAVVREKVTPLRDDPALLGWYSDSELPWSSRYAPPGGPPVAGAAGTDLLWQFLRMPAAAPGRAVAEAYLRSRLQRGPRGGGGAAAAPGPLSDGPALRAAAMEHEAAFAYNVSRAYFSQVADAIHAADPNHLLLGVKFTLPSFATTSPYTPSALDSFDSVLRGSRGFVDAHSIDVYSYTPGRDLLRHFYEESGVPWILAESMGYRGTINLSEDPNTKGAGAVVPDQQARARAWGVFARKALAMPYIVGLNHFTWADEPPGGRLGTDEPGEDSNYGLVSVDGYEYSELYEEIQRVLPWAAELHRAGAASPLSRCALDAAEWGRAAGLLQVAAAGAVRCLTAVDGGAAAAAPCTGAAAQVWEVVRVGGAAGHRLRNAGSGGCMHVPLVPAGQHRLRHDGNCSAPPDWVSPPSWEHDGDCSLMQACRYRSSAWVHPPPCAYNQSCVAVRPVAGGEAVVDSCTGSAQQRFAFVAA